MTEALTQLLANLSALPPESVSLAGAAGRVLARSLAAPFDLPPFSNSSMDGFAVLTSDLAGAGPQAPARLRVVADVPAGTMPHARLQAGQAARIMTGAPLPAGADAVVPAEETDAAGEAAGAAAPESVQMTSPVRVGANVRRQAEDLPAGATVLEAGVRLRPQDIGMAAMLGADPLEVVRRPRVAILATGDELQPPGMPPAPGKIFESNSFTLAALVEAMGGAVLRLGIAGDSRAAVQEKLDAAAAAEVDLILSSAGVSVGAYDYVRSVVEDFGSLDFWRVNMRPGKPLAFGTYRGIPFVGLPGNPVSSFVGFEVFVRPALAKMSGWTAWRREEFSARLAEPIESDGRESYLRAVVRQDGGWNAALTGHQSSGNQFSLVQANALVVVPAGVFALAAGAEVKCWKID